MLPALHTIADLKTQLKTITQGRDSIFITPDHPDYKAESVTWGAQRDLKPQLVLRPENLEQVQQIIPIVYKTDLDFVVRNGGVGSASSADVVITLSQMKDVNFDQETETVTVQAGALWEDVDLHMKTIGKGWAVVSSRTPFVGVAGIVVIGGLSWLSHEYGLISDPENLLDVQLVLGDGSLIWASEKPDLLWAIRGGRCAFGVITQLKFRARRYNTDSCVGGQITFPMNKLKEVSRGIASHVARNKDPKVAFHAFVLNPKNPFFDSPPGIGLMIFDGHGMEHARSEAGFKWAFDIEGVVDQTSAMTLYDVNHLTAFAKPLASVFSTHDCCGLAPEVDEELLVRATEWFHKVLETDDRLCAGSYCIVEVTQDAAFNSRKSASETAFPHTGHKHALQLGVGYSPDATDLKPVAQELLREAFRTIPKSPLGRGDFTPTFLEPSVVDVKQVYGPNYARLEKISEVYDPERRFRSLFRLGPNWSEPLTTAVA